MEPEAATAGGAGTEMAAPRPESGRGSPIPGRCAYFVERKKRFCKMIPAPGRRFCGEHGQQEVPGPCRAEQQAPFPGWGGWAPVVREPPVLWQGLGRRGAPAAPGGPGVACPPELAPQHGQEG